MNTDELLTKLAQAARGDAPPLVDVAGGILEAIGETRRPSNVLLWAFTAVSTAAAAMVALAALFQAPPAPTDAFSEIMRIVAPVI